MSDVGCRMSDVRFSKLCCRICNNSDGGSVENAECGVRSAECGKCGVWKMRGVENAECGKCGVWKMRGVENAECGKCGMWKMRSVENL